MSRLTRAEQEALSMLKNFDAFDESNFDESDFDSLAKKGVMRKTGAQLKVGNIAGNPVFQSQFNLNISITYVKDDAIIQSSGLDASLKSSLPVYIFGNIDFFANYKQIKNKLTQISGWVYQEEGVYGFDAFSTGGHLLSNPQVGDYLICYSKTIGEINYFAFIKINMPQTPYGSFLQAIGSDTFIINMIRYKVAKTLESQFENQLVILKLSLFGRTTDDTIDPQTYITSGTFQENISDIPAKLPVDKNLVLGTNINYDCQNISLTFTVLSSKKIQA
jgi:hypothetical protein